MQKNLERKSQNQLSNFAKKKKKKHSNKKEEGAPNTIMQSSNKTLADASFTTILCENKSLSTKEELNVP